MVVPKRADVIVVGGGPAGASTATHLARAGLQVVLFDKAAFPREKACAEYCSPGIVDALADLGALDSVRQREHRDLDRMRVVADGRELPLDFSADRSSSGAALGVKRSVLDDALLRFAESNGVEVHERTRAIRPVQDDGFVTGVEIRNGAGSQRTSAEFVVAADGIHSTIARSLGLERPLRWPNRLGLVARYEGLRTSLTAGQMHVGNRVYSGVTPVGEREALVSLVVPMGTKRAEQSTADFYEQELGQIPGIAAMLGEAQRVSRIRGVGPLGKRVRSRSGPGFLLVGDAAGFFDPLTGEGIHRALAGGEIAARGVMTALSRTDRQPVDYDEDRAHQFNDKERVCWIIQALTSAPPLLRYTADRAARRESVNSALRGVLGDYAPPRGAFRPSFLWNLFRP